MYGGKLSKMEVNFKRDLIHVIKCDWLPFLGMVLFLETQTENKMDWLYVKNG